MTTTVKISKTIICFPSIRGKYNFEYPERQPFYCKDDVTGSSLPWLCSDGLVAILVDDNSQFPSWYTRKIVWINPEDVKKQ